jgi:hypothetical protein
MIKSSISWLHFSDQQRRKMMEVVSLFKERDTRDELGLGSIRNSFADLLFPGTTTLQTRARYFLFVPWLYRYYEERRVPSVRVADRLRNDEIRLIRSLQASGLTDGVIGRISGESLHRFPSNLYWIGMQIWGILQFQGTQSQYHRSLDAFYHQQRGQIRTDDYDSVSSRLPANWDPHLPPRPNDFPEQVSFQLTYKEAAYLRERLLLSCPKSLLAALIEGGFPHAECEFAWEHPHRIDLPANLHQWLILAQNFSEAMHGAALLYNLMLSQKAKLDEGVDDYHDRLESWRKQLIVRKRDLHAWDRKKFWELADQNGRIPYPTRDFVNRWLDLILSLKDFDGVAENDTARALIQEREYWLKRGRSRFENPRRLEVWGGASGTAQLDYRWRIANRLIRDILQGLSAGGEN